MQNMDTLILAHGMMHARHDGVPLVSNRRTWVERDGFLPLLCAQLIFKRFWSIFERIATETNPFAYNFSVRFSMFMSRFAKHARMYTHAHTKQHNIRAHLQQSTLASIFIAFI